jgi:uncharacterized protein (TIGR03067 family)
MRRLLPLLVALCLAFAPAPPPRGAAPVTLRTFQGAWKVVSIESVDEKGGKKPTPWNVNRIRVEGDQFTYLGGDMPIGRDRLVIDASKQPALIDFYSKDRAGAEPYRVGLIKAARGRVVLLFYQTGPENRAKSFDKPPSFWWWVVLERER